MSTSVQTDSACDQALERCCVALEQECERQSRVLEICLAQGRAARLRDVNALEAASRDLVGALQEVLRAEAHRMAAVLDAARGLRLSPDDVRLSRLIAAAPEPWRDRLRGIQRRLKSVIGITQRLVEANSRFIREGARTAERLLGEVLGDVVKTDAYDRGGQKPVSKPAANALLNVAG